MNWSTAAAEAKRRDGIEPIDYPSPAPPRPKDELSGILEKTLGVPLSKVKSDIHRGREALKQEMSGTHGTV